MPDDDRNNLQFVLLSAPTDEQLETCVRQLLEFIGALPDDPRFTLANIAFTLQVGREVYAKRLAIPASSISELNDRFAKFLSGSRYHVRHAAISRSDFEDSDTDHHHEQTAAALAAGDTEALVALWLCGVAIDWRGLKRSEQCCRVGLPGYPFKLRRYWITESRGLPTTNSKHLDVDAPTDPARVSQPSRSSEICEQGEDGMTTSHYGKSDSNTQNGTQKIVLSQLPPRTTKIAMSDVGQQEMLQDDAGAVSVTAKGGSQNADALCTELKQSLAKALFLEVDQIDVDQTFVDMGVDSLVGIDWIRNLNKTYDVTVRVTKIYDFPTLRAFSEFLAQEISFGSGRQDGRSQPERLPHLATPVEMLESAEPQSVLAQLACHVAACLAGNPNMVDVDAPWRDVGIDEQLQQALLDRLSGNYAITLKPVDLIHFPTVRELAKLVEGQIEHAEPALLDDNAPTPKLSAGTRRPQGTQGEIPKEYGLVVSTVSQISETALSSWQVGTPDRGEIQIEVCASAVNFPDVMCINGLYPTMPEYPFVPDFEVAGTVAAVGADVSEHRVGDEVIAMTDKVMGGHARLVNIPAANAIRKPNNLTFEEACRLPVCFSTVWLAFERCRLDEGETVLVHTASGGCGLVALQLAALKHCNCIATSSKERKRNILRSLGIEHVLDYRTSFDEGIRQITNGRGVDVVLNMVSGEALQRGLNSLAPSGRYVELAVHALKTSAPLDLTGLVDNQSFISLDLRRLGAHSGRTGPAAVLAKMLEMTEADKLAPIVSRIYPLSQMRDALEFVAAGNHIGKVVISHTAAVMTDCEEECLERVRRQRQRAVAHSIIQSPAEPIRVVRQPAETSVALEPMAIIGMSGQFPKAANLAAFWNNLEHGVDCVTNIPVDRWNGADDASIMEANTATPLYQHMGVLDNADHFAASFFNISPKEARLMDPQQRIFLQDSWSCIENAGYAPSALADLRCGVFVGCSSSDYATQFKGSPSVHMLMGNASSILAARISYLLNLKGPCLAIDTGCSSSLVAISDACSSLATGACDVALAGGVNVASSPWLNAMLADAGMLSADGRCFTFDKRANGFVPAEGVGTVLLKRLADAERDGDHINGVIIGWGINHDGKTNGMTAPSGKSQTALECDVYERFGIDASTISYVEAHGTGTSLGDPIEVEALVNAFRSHTDKERFCALGSVKSNIGHAICAAGVASVLKVALSMQHNKLPPTINFTALNEEISLDGTPFYVNDTLQHWTGPRRAAVSSFSYNGTNAHLVIEHHEPAPERKGALPTAVPILLSARNVVELDGQVKQLSAWAQSMMDRDSRFGLKTPAIDDVAYTLQTGRDHMGERLGVLARSWEDLVNKLQSFVTSPENLPEDMLRTSVDVTKRNSPTGDVPQAKNDTDPPIADRNPDWPVLLAQWAAGQPVDWANFHQFSSRKRVPLPTYSFEKKKYHIKDHDGADKARHERSGPAGNGAMDSEARFKELLSRIDRSKGNGFANGPHIPSG